MHRRLLIIAFALLVITAGVATAASTQRQVLVVEDAETGETLLTTPVSENSTVALEYTHSVEKSLVVDEYTVRDGQLEMTKMVFHSYGAGLPARADVRVVNGSYVFDPPGTYEELYVQPGEIAGHRLRVDGRTYDLVDVGNARTVRVSVTERSALDVALSQL